MGEPRILVGEGYSIEKVRMAMAIIQSQILAAGELHLPAIKRQDRGPFNKSKEIERRRKQIERRRK